MNYVYILRCGDNSLYTGWTNDPEKRLAAHQSGKGSRYTRARLPVEMVYLETCVSKQAAMSREYEIKQLSHPVKLQMVEAYQKRKEKK